MTKTENDVKHTPLGFTYVMMADICYVYVCVYGVFRMFQRDGNDSFTLIKSYTPINCRLQYDLSTKIVSLKQ